MASEAEAINITGVVLFAQFLIAVVMVVGASIIHIQRQYFTSFSRDPKVHLFTIIVFFAIVSVGVLLLSADLSGVWRPFLPDGMELEGFRSSSAITASFFADVAGITILVAVTGGCKNSPFTPLYFLLPPLAIFLKEPLSWILVYVVVISGAFVVATYRFVSDTDTATDRSSVAFITVSILSFGIATLVGYLVRPI